MCASHRYKCAGSPYNEQGFVAENLNIFSNIVTFILIDQKNKSVLFRNRMTYSAEKLSNGAEDTVEIATFFSNTLPLHVLNGNKVAVFVANYYKSRDLNF